MIRPWLGRLVGALSSSQRVGLPSGQAIARAFGLALIGVGPFLIMGATHREPVAKRDGIAIIHPWSRGSALVGDELPVYVTFENSSQTLDRLIAVETPFAQNVVLKIVDKRPGMPRTVELDDLPLPPNSKVGLRPEKQLISLVGVTERIEPGRTIPITFFFSRAGRLVAEVQVESPGQPPHQDHS